MTDGFEMRELHRSILSKNRSYLLHNLLPTETFWSALISKEILSEEMVEYITVRWAVEKSGEVINLQICDMLEDIQII